MSIVPVSCLSKDDLAHLGNNLIGEARKDHHELRAVNRSLAVHDEAVHRLRRPLFWGRARMTRKLACAA
jgi:hypothetical protein